MYDSLIPQWDIPTAIRAYNQEYNISGFLGQARNEKGIYGRKKEWDIVSVGFSWPLILGKREVLAYFPVAWK